ncbi:hypothetical protein [Flavobacterium sp. GCM10027622]|uniref:hypothetical protein n=1 Tax=unclassified Flavobacterium TaxID=196869 RepID=UPI003615081E
MKKIFLFLVSIIIAFTQTSCDQKRESKISFKDFEVNLAKDEEPPLIFELKSENGTEYFIENQSKKWKGLDKGTQTTISVYDWKMFPHNNIQFEYPRTYTFEADLSTTNDIWTLSGNDFKIMIIRPLVELDVKEYVNEMISQFGKANCSTKKITKKINTYRLDGMKLSATLSGIPIEIDVFEIIDKSGNKSLLVFQDALTDNNENSNESRSTMKRIEQTLQIN